MQLVVLYGMGGVEVDWEGVKLDWEGMGSQCVSFPEWIGMVTWNVNSRINCLGCPHVIP